MSLIHLISILGSGNPSESTYYTPLVNQATVADNGWYEGYDFPFQYSDGSLVGFYRRSASHTDDGPIMFRRSTDGGATYTHEQVVVDGSPITGQALTAGLITVGANTGRLIVGYQALAASNVMLAYRDGLTGDFTSCGTVNAPANTSMNFSTAPIRAMPEGDLRFGVYILPIGGLYSKARFINGSSDGLLWSMGGDLITHTTQATASPYTDWMFNEWDWICTHDTGVNATSKFIAFFRVALPNDGGTYYLFRKSTGGSTWTYEAVDDAGSFIDDNGNTVSGPFSRSLFYRFLASNSPVSLAIHGGNVYIANGERNLTYGFAQKYTWATPDQAFANVYSSWAAPTDVFTFNDTNGNSTDVGYGVLYEAKDTEAGSPKLWTNPYEMSTLAPTNTLKRTRIRQIKIAD